jgi:hypothetical protein
MVGIVRDFLPRERLIHRLSEAWEERAFEPIGETVCPSKVERPGME